MVIVLCIAYYTYLVSKYKIHLHEA